MISVEEAQARILAEVPAAVAELVALRDANGRVLAAPLKAAHTQPPFDSSAMDGYAVRAADVTPGIPLRMIGTSQAGQRFVGMMGAGHCVRIFTGAPMPIGADSVIMQEEATANGTEISFSATPRVGQSVRARGNDFHQGHELLPAGFRLTPAALNLAASANQPAVTVARRPRIAVLATGDELVAPGRTPGPDQIIASNSFGLIPLFAPHAADIMDLGIVRDDKADIEAALLQALDAGVDAIVTTGGASVGERDYIQDVLIDLGVKLDFWKIAMRPGKPLMFGTRGKTLVFGLPGNPVSALVTATIIVLPALRAFAGDTDPLPPHLGLPLAEALPANGPRTHFIRANLAHGSDGQTWAVPLSQTDSAHSSSLALADALIVHAANDPGREAGAIVQVVMLR
jgi:molybdopterin molybdotransferase